MASGQSLLFPFFPYHPPMRKQTVILTVWLILPFIAIGLLMAWLFYSLDKDRLMQDAPPVGAGAGDTGNANALGQLLAGRDPDEISKANDARREGTEVESFNWPGGTLLTFEHIPPQSLDSSTLEAHIALEHEGEYTFIVDRPFHMEGDKWGVELKQFEHSVSSAKIAVGYKTQDSDSFDWEQTSIPLRVVAGSALSSDPIEIPLRINVVAP